MSDAAGWRRTYASVINPETPLIYEATPGGYRIRQDGRLINIGTNRDLAQEVVDAHNDDVLKIQVTGTAHL